MSKKMITFCDSQNQTHDFPIETPDYGTCATAGDVAEKVVVSENFSLYTGAKVTVKFANANTAGTITLNVNGTGANTVYFPGDGTYTTDAGEIIQAGGCYDFVYDDGWRFVGAAGGGSGTVENVDIDVENNRLLVGDGANGFYDQYEPTKNIVVVGNNATASAVSVTIGNNAGSSGTNGVAIGNNSKNSGADNIAIGCDATTTGVGSVAVGSSASVTQQGGVAVGAGAQATASGAIQIGEGTNSTASTFQVGSYQLLDASGKIPAERLNSSGTVENVTITEDSIAIGEGAENNPGGSNNVAIGKSASGWMNSVAVGSSVLSTNQNTTAVGANSEASSVSATAIGAGAKALGENSIQIGSGTNDTANTFQVGDYTLLDANGNIPDERLANADTVNVINNLTSTSTTDALSANQGKVLNDDLVKILNNEINIQNSNGGFAAGDGASVTRSSIAIGKDAIAEGLSAPMIAIGYGTNATNTGAVAIGYYAQATGTISVAIGGSSTNRIAANGSYSFCTGSGNSTQAYQTKFGRHAKDGTAGSSTGTTGDVFILGNGTSSTPSNAFRVTYAGKAYGLSSYSSSGADYAEYFEWSDGNPNDEDRRGRIVTLDGEKIRFATADDTYILGVISANPCVEGDVFSDDWQGKYLTDAFGARVTQVVHVDAIYEDVETVDPETGETVIEQVKIEDEHDAVQWVLNPDYDPDQEYVSREERKEWAAVGSMGKLVVVDDGTCVVGKYCRPSENGIGTHSENDGYRVMSRIDDTHVKVWVR